MYFVLVDGYPIFRLGLGLSDKDIRKQYKQCLDDLERGGDGPMNELPGEVSSHFTPIIRKLLDQDPQLRLSVEDLDRNECLMHDYAAAV